MKTKIKTIDVNCKEWFGKVNGNSYFAGSITINYGLPTQKILNMPYQYGYGSHSLDIAGQLIQKEFNIKTEKSYFSLWQYCEANKIILRYSKQENCKKRELMEY